MSNVDINVDRRTDGLTDGLTDGRTDGRKIGRLYRTLLQAGAIKMKANRIYTVVGKKETKCARESWHYVTGCSRDVAFVVR